MLKITGVVVNDNDYSLLGYFVESNGTENRKEVREKLQLGRKVMNNKSLTAITMLRPDAAREVIEKYNGISNAVVTPVGIREKPGTKRFYEMPLYNQYGKRITQGMSLVAKVETTKGSPMGYEVFMYSDCSTRVYSTVSLIRMAQYISPDNFVVRKVAGTKREYTIATRAGQESIKSLPIKHRVSPGVYA